MLAILFIILILIAKGVWNIYGKERSAMADRIDTERQIAALRERQTFLENEVNRLKTKNGVEREIREKFNVKKEGEEVAVIVDEPTDPDNEQKPSLTSRLASWFKRIFE